MFTGIVEEIGHVRAIEVADGHASLTVDAPHVAHGLQVGDSIAVDGCCLTASRVDPGGFTSDLMAETLSVTTLGQLGEGAPINLERAMAADDRFGGHLVQGHVDGVGIVVDREELPGTVFLSIRADTRLARYLVPKGSVAVSGTSLTVVDLPDEVTFRIGLIPHTLEATNLGIRQVGERVNLEADVIAKYVERLLGAGASVPYLTSRPGRDERDDA